MQANKEMISLFKDSIKKNGWLDLPAQGFSMYPLIREGNICRFIPHEPSLLKKGDIVLFYTLTGQLITHRLCKTIAENGEQFFLFKGDSNLGFDELVREHQIIGKLVHIQGRSLQIENFLAIVFGRLILSSPVLSRIFRMYINKFKTP
ncbi:signal peptidase I [Gottfriedia solisilvae]|uniref:signal peptidase I n=1 Tax=Gottfriedia solisilvae TaxID=1516104 RepID=UPI003D2EC091